MLKEIFEQPRLACELLRLLDDSPNSLSFVERMTDARNLYLIGCGSSYHACILGSIYLAMLASRPAVPVRAPQFIAQYIPTLNQDDVVIFVSQSGETREVLSAVEAAQMKGVRALGLVNTIGSTLMNFAEVNLPLLNGPDIVGPATKSFCNQAITFLHLALQMSNVPITGLAHLPGMMESTLDVAAPQIEQLSSTLRDDDRFYCLGYGSTYPIALEGALMIKEMTYAHCEGMLCTELKHINITGIKGLPTFFVASPGDVQTLIEGIAIANRLGSYTFAIAEADNRLKNCVKQLVELPVSGPLFSPLLSVLPLQLLSYYLGKTKGIIPNFANAQYFSPTHTNSESISSKG